MDMFDIVSRTAEGLLAIFSVLVIFVKPFRSWILGTKDRRKREEQKDRVRDEATRCTLRTIFTEFFFSHNSVCTLHQYEYENLAKTYAAYKQLNGNSFVDKIWEEIQDWTIIP